MQRNESIFAKLFKWFKRKYSINEEVVVDEISKQTESESIRCPQCGSILVNLGGGPCLGDPDKYKCAYCLYTCFVGGIKFRNLEGEFVDWEEHEIIDPPKSVNYYAPLHDIQYIPEYIPDDISKKNKDCD